MSALGNVWQLIRTRGLRLRHYPSQTIRRVAFGRRHAGCWAPRATARRIRERNAMRTDILARGPRAQAVLAAARIEGSVEAPTVVLADTAAHAAGAAAPTVLLSRTPTLAVPGFDPAQHNPVGWRRNPNSWSAALGSLHHLPPTAVASRVVPPSRRRLLQRCFEVEDVAAFHGNTVARAATLARLAASGVVIHLADRDSDLERLLGTRLYALMTDPLRRCDVEQRESASIRMRRLALRKHALPARARAVYEVAGVRPPAHPPVSVLLATRRPELLHCALRSVAKQDYPNLELVLALHGGEFDTNAVAEMLTSLPLSLHIVQVGGDRPLGAVLNAASGAAGGELLTKMDDDDLYDRHHVWDLVLAHQYSGAMLVGKGIEYVYLASSDETIRRNSGYAECRNVYLAGGALMIARRDLERIGGWRELPVGVDQSLIEDVLRAGGTVYRTHGHGFLLVRHGREHTWRLDENRFRRQADVVRNGCVPALADIDDEPFYRY